MDLVTIKEKLLSGEYNVSLATMLAYLDEAYEEQDNLATEEEG